MLTLLGCGRASAAIALTATVARSKSAITTTDSWMFDSMTRQYTNVGAGQVDGHTMLLNETVCVWHTGPDAGGGLWECTAVSPYTLEEVSPRPANLASYDIENGTTHAGQSATYNVSGGDNDYFSEPS